MLSEYEIGKLEGFCWMIKELFMDQDFEDHWENNVNHFKELKSKKPNRLETNHGSWFRCDKDGRQKRMKILKECIEETY